MHHFELDRVEAALSASGDDIMVVGIRNRESGAEVVVHLPKYGSFEDPSRVMDERDAMRLGRVLVGLLQGITAKEDS